MATTSSGTITSTTSNGTSRITGLSSGIDVDSLVEQLMTAEKTKLNKLEQAQQLAEWRQEAYQTVIDKIMTFSDTYFSSTSSSSLIRTTTYSQYEATSDSSAVTATASTSATVGTHTISVSSLATAATLQGASLSIQGDSAADYTAAQGASFTITLDGTDYTVSLDSSLADAAGLQDAIDEAVGEGKLTVSDASGVLSIAPIEGSGVYSVTLSDTSGSALTALGFGSDSVTNCLDTDATLAEIAESMVAPFSFNDEGQIAFTINDVEFTFDQDETLAEMMDEINSSDAGVTMQYNSVTNKLVLTADQLGAGATITSSEADSTFITTLLGNATAGTDAKVTLDGETLTLSANEVTADGVTYTFKKVTTEDAIVDVLRDTDTIYDAITGFVEAYNTLLEDINAELSADYDYDYPPLTDDQKEEMTDDEIEDWEETAKTGLLEDDSILRSLLADLREAVMDPVSGLSTYLSDIGIETSDDYTEQGKLVVDETELQEAIANDPEGVMNLFAQKSTSYSDSSEVRTLGSTAKAVRLQEEGIAYRFYDILQDNVGQTTDSQGNYGLLLEKAGCTSTEYDNALTDLIEDYQDKIDAEEERLEDKETYYYDKYTTMETYLNTLSSQYSALTSMLSSDS